MTRDVITWLNSWSTKGTIAISTILFLNSIPIETILTPFTLLTDGMVQTVVTFASDIVAIS